MIYIDKSYLYGNKENAQVLCNYQREIKLIKRLIDISEKAVNYQEPTNTWSYEGVCHLFAKDIVDYSKMAFDNLILGNFRGTKMINRTVLENLVCLDLIVHNDELWKYYLVYSYRNVIYKLNHIPTDQELDRLEGLYEVYDISEDFYIKQEGRRKSYIKEPYGWTYKINDTKQFTFEKMCNLIGEDSEYKGYKMLSDYSHGTSLYMKIHGLNFMENIISMFVDMYINLFRMVMMYCDDFEDEEFVDVTDELECIFQNI